MKEAYTLSVITVQTVVSHHLYRNDQFCGLEGSLGPSQVTTFGSALFLGRKDGGVDSRSCGPLPLQSSRDASSRSTSSLTVDVGECKEELGGTLAVRD
jgi:hypothetical protein